MPVKFVTKLLKTLFGVSGKDSQETEAGTNITVERETGEASADKNTETDGTDETEDLADETEQLADESEGTDETEEVDETDETGEVDETDETEEVDETDETEEVDETDETEEVDETDETEEVDETEQRTDEAAEADETEETEEVDEIRGIGPTYSDRLSEVDIETVGDLAKEDPAAVAAAAEVSESRATDWIERAKNG